MGLFVLKEFEKELIKKLNVKYNFTFELPFEEDVRLDDDTRIELFIRYLKRGIDYNSSKLPILIDKIPADMVEGGHRRMVKDLYKWLHKQCRVYWIGEDRKYTPKEMVDKLFSYIIDYANRCDNDIAMRRLLDAKYNCSVCPDDMEDYDYVLFDYDITKGYWGEINVIGFLLYYNFLKRKEILNSFELQDFYSGMIERFNVCSYSYQVLPNEIIEKEFVVTNEDECELKLHIGDIPDNFNLDNKIKFRVNDILEQVKEKRKKARVLKSIWEITEQHKGELEKIYLDMVNAFVNGEDDNFALSHKIGRAHV